jgi:hypothetical protein
LFQEEFGSGRFAFIICVVGVYCLVGSRGGVSQSTRAGLTGIVVIAAAITARKWILRSVIVVDVSLKRKSILVIVEM